MNLAALYSLSLAPDRPEGVATRSRFVGDVTTATIRGITKDDFHFGVRAVDDDGHRSQVRFPTAVRRQPRRARAPGAATRGLRRPGASLRIVRA